MRQTETWFHLLTHKYKKTTVIVREWVVLLLGYNIHCLATVLGKVDNALALSLSSIQVAELQKVASQDAEKPQASITRHWSWT